MQPKAQPQKQLLSTLLFPVLGGLAAVVGALSILVLSYGVFIGEERDKADGRLTLLTGTLNAELDRYNHLSYVLAQDPRVLEALRTSDKITLNPRLTTYASDMGLDAIFLMTPKGQTIAASNAGRSGSFIGQNYGYRPYFLAAMAGRRGHFYGIGATTKLPGYFISHPVRSPTGQIKGVLAIKINLSRMSKDWQLAGKHVLLSNADGIVLLASNPKWRYRTMAPLTDDQRREIAFSRQFPNQPLPQLDWAPLGRLSKAFINGEKRLYRTSGDLPHGWTLHYFTTYDEALTKSALLAGIALVAAAGALVASQLKRNRRIGAALARSEEEEAGLRRANMRLAREIEVRRRAEMRLKRTQAELESASRLAALGRLAASVTHELGQPIAAMNNLLVAADITGKAPKLPALTALVARMEDTARQLKFFARSDDEPMSPVDLTAATRTALELVAPNLQTANLRGHRVELHLDIPPTPVLVHGNRLRLEQVLTNLLRNAIDAMEDTPEPKLFVTVANTLAGALIEVRDTGHGLGQATLDELKEPFVTTRESGRGMGLGLAISAGIIQDHDAKMEAWNRTTGGCAFRVTFPPHTKISTAPNAAQHSPDPSTQTATEPTTLIGRTLSGQIGTGQIDTGQIGTGPKEGQTEGSPPDQHAANSPTAAPRFDKTAF